jgi:hypothetical protein
MDARLLMLARPIMFDRSSLVLVLVVLGVAVLLSLLSIYASIRNRSACLESHCAHGTPAYLEARCVCLAENQN